MATLRQLTFTHKLAKDDRPRNKRDLRTISTVYPRQDRRPRSARNPVILKILLILSKNTSARHGFADVRWQVRTLPKDVGKGQVYDRRGRPFGAPPVSHCAGSEYPRFFRPQTHMLYPDAFIF